jgi:uncharacterized repeat protein (TIGR03803 family)
MKRVLLLLVSLVSCPIIFQCTIASAGVKTINSIAPQGGSFRVDYTFTGEDGGMPTAAMIQDGAGNLYGTTSSGGSSHLGVVFKLDTDNNETVLHTFTGPDGATPYGSLVRDGSGNLYGTTSAGGSSGLGTVFKIDPSGTETVLHNFTGNPDGAKPYAGLVMDPSSGNLYGTTEQGGTSNLGTVFGVDNNGTETVLHSFTGGPDGADPKARLMLDAGGNLYGTTFTGGSSSAGTVFELDTTNTESVLYAFTGGSDGGNPFGGVTQDSDGVLYGTTENGGSAMHYGCCKGVAFSVSGGSEQVLYTFTGGKDGGTPASDLILYNGVLYGTTLSGGFSSHGTAFSLTIAKGKGKGKNREKVLHGFTGRKDGASPRGGLLLNAQGVLYGTAQKGGRFKQGTVFQVNK